MLRKRIYNASLCNIFLDTENEGENEKPELNHSSEELGD